MNEIIKKILDIEWDMFTNVNNIGGRASCQDDKMTFTVMRSAQFKAWDEASQESYLHDLEAARGEERNLVAEKYAHMMAYTAPDEYAEIADRIKLPTERARELADKIFKIVFRQTMEYEKVYPNIAKHGRPMNSSDDDIFTSIETYQKGELFTYSETTLAHLLAHIEGMEKDGKNYPLEILKNTFEQYGFRTLDDAESFLARH